MKLINHETVAGQLNWKGVVDAIHQGHLKPRAQIGDQFLTREGDTLLSRAAWIDGLGFGVKSVSVMPGNGPANLPSVQGAMLVFEDRNGAIEAIVDSALVTQWKTAGDSAFGAKLLARADAQNYLIIGSGVVAENLIAAFSEILPNLRHIEIWSRTYQNAQALANKMTAKGYAVTAVSDLEQACARAGIVSTATMSKTPVLRGQWIKQGTHVDLIGAFKKDMREADDALLQKSSIFVDCFDTTIDHIGEIMIPLASGAIARGDIIADLYDLAPGKAARTSTQEITLFKNGGGAHLDLMTAKYIMGAL